MSESQADLFKQLLRWKAEQNLSDDAFENAMLNATANAITHRMQKEDGLNKVFVCHLGNESHELICEIKIELFAKEDVPNYDDVHNHANHTTH